MVLTFTGTTVHHARGLKIKSVLLTANSSDPAILQFYPYAVTDVDPIFTVATPIDTTVQVVFDDLPIPSGVTIVAVDGVSSYLVEYADQ